MSTQYRAAIIGHTGQGNYGHGLEMVYGQMPEVEVAAVADPDPEGLAAAGERTGAARGYADYREMLDAMKPDFVSIAPGWVTERVPMITAAAAVGAHIYCEKPAAGSVKEMDAIVAEYLV